jgi:acyl carrier protein
MESFGAEVMVSAADVADEAAMQEVIDRVHDRFGRISGVIHAAGTVAPESFFGVDQAQPSGCELHFRPKIRGVLVLEKLLRAENLDFCLVASSLSSLLAGIGFSAYAAANAFLDAFAALQARRTKTPWFSVNWDNWKFSDYVDTTVSGDLAMQPPEGVETVRRILTRAAPGRVVVSTTSLQARLDQWINFKTAASPPPNAAALHPRPELATEYVSPRDEAEAAIVAIWQELLGIAQIGVHDNFFELGGQSLLATQLVARVREAFKSDLPLREFFQGPTVNELALAIASRVKQTSEQPQSGAETAAKALQPEHDPNRNQENGL